MNLVNKILVLVTLASNLVFADTIYDTERNRHIPIQLDLPLNKESCNSEQQCPVAFLSAGYGVSLNKYRFMVEQLKKLNYLVVSVGHELPTDPPLSVKGNLFETRKENWIRGAETLRFLHLTMLPEYPAYDLDQVLLLGHSNGGDISSWLVNEDISWVSRVITLDHRRVPLPRKPEVKVLSIRGSDFPADKGVLPSTKETETYPICVVKIPDSRHNDMTDYGPEELKSTISKLVSSFLVDDSCEKATVPTL